MTGSWSDKVMETSFCAASISACKNGSSNQFVHVKVSALMLKSIKMFDISTQWLKITEKVSFNIVSEASYVYIHQKKPKTVNFASF